MQVLAFHPHVGGALALGLADTGDIAHLTVCVSVFIGMGLVNKEVIHAKLLKVQQVVLAFLVSQALQARSQVFLENLHLLDRPRFPVFLFHQLDDAGQGDDFLVELAFLPLL